MAKEGENVKPGSGGAARSKAIDDTVTEMQHGTQKEKGPNSGTRHYAAPAKDSSYAPRKSDQRVFGTPIPPPMVK